MPVQPPSSAPRQPSLLGDEPAPLPPATPAQPAAGTAAADSVPLAERLRPQTLGDVVGQAHLLGPGKPLALAHARGRLPSMILWGPPGVGKTTLARILARGVDAHLVTISAVLGGVKDIREAVAEAEARRAAGQATILFVDEVHRFNKAQQDAFLPHVESGLLTFIGATTENPAFEVNAALLSRATVFVLQSLDAEALAGLVARAQAETGAAGFTDAARDRLVASADGDARRLLNLLEGVWASAEAGADGLIDEPQLERALGRALRRYDKGGDQFFDAISALHKSVRGSNPDATLYWLARMLDGGADARYVARRLVRMASEDIGLADPRALTICTDAAAAFERLGSPEGELALAQAAVYLAVAPKSNAVYKAWNAARAFVAQDQTRPVPDHLRNAPTKLAKQLGHGAAYRYPHDEPEAYAAGATYLPEGMAQPGWYRPVPRGLEQRIADKMDHLRALDGAANVRNDPTDGHGR